MTNTNYIEYNKSQITKIGNTIIYLVSKLENKSKTKLLKLLYILDEISIIKSGIPFLNLKYKVWKFGPVSEELFIDFSTSPTLLKEFISRDSENGEITPLKSFDDSEFSDFDMILLDEVIANFGNKTAQELIDYTHRPNAPWYETAKANSVLEKLEKEIINSTEYHIDLSMLVAHDKRKLELLEDYIECN